MKNLDFLAELKIKATRSSGKGGQHVNKVSSKVELFFNLNDSDLLSENEKSILSEKWRNHLSQDGFLRIVCQEERSQLANKEKVLKKFYALLTKSLEKPKKRLATKPKRTAVEERLKEKQMNSIKKERRKSDLTAE